MSGLLLVPFLLASGPRSILVRDRPEVACKGKLIVSTPAFRANGKIPVRFTHYDENNVPTIQWSALPKGTKSVVVLCEDPDAPSARPFLHWLRWSNDLGKTWVEGVNDTDERGYFGPQPPAGGVHHYHFQVFAVAKPIKVADPLLTDVLAAIKGKVLAKGEVVGLFTKPE